MTALPPFIDIFRCQIRINQEDFKGYGLIPFKTETR